MYSSCSAIFGKFYLLDLVLLLQKFALDGLRTLCLGTRDLTEQEFSDWKAAHHSAAIALENREEKLDAVYNFGCCSIDN